MRSHLVRVPVGVKDNHGVGRLQVEAEASSSCAQEEDEVEGPKYFVETTNNQDGLLFIEVHLQE
ncbi:hypothetical protein EYF80_006129 [Liparis tanakae]|uniref:Uncharacterized protein n=1 Tax=Liparis tanakae TaxID=230148 RepID=A0A4Z2J0Z0_9TELE|nr:hypothetical protein EYF80_006129 [Liparis tanakae]